jgi:hypothetical protein
LLYFLLALTAGLDHGQPFSLLTRAPALPGRYDKTFAANLSRVFENRNLLPVFGIKCRSRIGGFL